MIADMITQTHCSFPISTVSDSSLISVECHNVSNESGSDRVSLSKIRIANCSYTIAIALRTDLIAKLE